MEMGQSVQATVTTEAALAQAGAINDWFRVGDVDVDAKRLDTLVRRGHLERRKDEERRNVWRITPRGRQHLRWLQRQGEVVA